MEARLLVRLATPLAVLMAGPAAAQAPTDTARALAEVRAAEAARLRGDSAAWQLLAPGFVFVHSTGAVNDRATFLALRARGAASGARVPETRDAEPPVVRLDDDVLVTARLVGDSAPRGVPVAADSVALDELAGTYVAPDGTRRVFTRRGGTLLFAGPAGERPMVPLSDATFGYPGVIATVTFVRNRSGQVIAADESAQVGFRRYRRAGP